MLARTSKSPATTRFASVGVAPAAEELRVTIDGSDEAAVEMLTTADDGEAAEAADDGKPTETAEAAEAAPADVEATEGAGAAAAASPADDPLAAGAAEAPQDAGEAEAAEPEQQGGHVQLPAAEAAERHREAEGEGEEQQEEAGQQQAGRQRPALRAFLLKPETGRTHQLRVALKSLGAPVLGDEVRGGVHGSLWQQYGERRVGGLQVRRWCCQGGLAAELLGDFSSGCVFGGGPVRDCRMPPVVLSLAYSGRQGTLAACWHVARTIPHGHSSPPHCLPTWVPPPACSATPSRRRQPKWTAATCIAPRYASRCAAPPPCRWEPGGRTAEGGGKEGAAGPQARRVLRLHAASVHQCACVGTPLLPPAARTSPAQVVCAPTAGRHFTTDAFQAQFAAWFPPGAPMLLLLLLLLLLLCCDRACCNPETWVRRTGRHMPPITTFWWCLEGHRAGIRCDTAHVLSLLL